MGTSNAFGGAGGGTPLVPSWLDDAPADGGAPPAAPADDGGGADGDGGQPAPAPPVPNAPPPRPPNTQDGFKDIFGNEISRDLIGRLHARELIGTRPRAPKRGALYTFVTTEQFLVALGWRVCRTCLIKRRCRTRG